MVPKTLTPVERLLLANQFRILEKLYPDSAEEYAKMRSIVAQGYTIEYEGVFNEVWDEMDIGECNYVFDVLEMYDTLERSYDALSDKAGLRPEDVCFRGFDGNNESRRFMFAQHLRNEGKWTETLAGNLDSHSKGTMLRYPRMLAKYKPIAEKIRGEHGDWQLTADQIKEVIS
jgi:hypothetical protein